jgi:hypothetical protein
MPTERLAYTDADTSSVMARDASACRTETHLARALDGVAVGRRVVETAPAVLLEVPRKVARTAVSVTESTARFAARLFE